MAEDKTFLEEHLGDHWLVIVIAGGLDAPIEGGRDRATRSLLYRAITRAHMLAAVVNELVPGGWLEWLAHVKLDDKAFDRGQERKRADDGGARRLPPPSPWTSSPPRCASPSR